MQSPREAKVIAARKSALFTAWFARDAERRIRRSFDAVHVSGLARLRATLGERPVLVVTNHTAWWDPLVALWLSVRVLRADAYAMMDAANLEKLPFFGKVGAFGVDLRDPADGARAIRYAAKLLARPGRLVWVFAQGREVPITARPLGFRPGSGEIARVSRHAAVIPGALRYELGATQRPAIWASFGDALERPANAHAACEIHEARVLAELDAIDTALVGARTLGFETLHQTRPSTLSRLAEAALAWLTRPKTLR